MPQSIFEFNGNDNDPISAELTRSGATAAIINNRAQATQTAAEGGASFLLRDTGIDDFDITAVMSSSGSATSARITFRSLTLSNPDDYNNVSLSPTGEIQILSQQGGSQSIQYTTTVSTHVTGYAAGDDLTVRAVGVGSAITLFLNGTEITTVTNSNNISGATIHGIRLAGLDSNVDRLVMEDSNPVTDVVANVPPTANAGADQTVNTNTLVTLDGTGSTDADGTIASYAWTQTAGTTQTLSDPTAAQPTFTPTTEETFTFSLVVTDNDGATSAADTVNITAQAQAITSTANVTITGIADGSQAVKIRNRNTGAVLFNGNLTFSSGSASTTLSVPVGTIFTGRWLGNNPPTTGTSIYGVTV